MSDGKIIQENGENIIPITHETCVLDDEGNPITETIGDVSLLNTESRNLVGAINEVFGDTIKEQVVGVLIGKGIDASTNEPWSELIIKLEEDSGGGDVLDIISATELPATGKENQVCIITENPVDKYVITTNYEDVVTDDSIILYQGSTVENNVEDIVQLPIQGEKILSYYYFNRVIQNDLCLASYYYTNNNWVQLTNRFLELVRNKVLLTSVTGGVYPDANKTTYVEGTGVVIAGTSNTNTLMSFNKPFNLSLYNTLEITMYCNYTGNIVFICGKSSTGINNVYGTIPTDKITPWFTNSINMKSTPTKYTIDISSLTGEGYLVVGINIGNNVNIVDMKLY